MMRTVLTFAVVLVVLRVLLSVWRWWHRAARRRSEARLQAVADAAEAVALESFRRRVEARRTKRAKLDALHRRGGDGAA